MLKKIQGCLVRFAVVLMLLSGICYAEHQDYKYVKDRCAANNATWSPRTQQCVCNSGYTLSGVTCVRSGSSSGSSSAGDLGTVLGTILGNALADSIRGNQETGDASNAAQAAAAAERKRLADEQAAEQRRLAAEKRRLAAEQAAAMAAEQARLADEAQARLLGSMQGLDASPQLNLIGGDSAPELQLMTGDTTPTNSWEEYRSWEKYKRDILAYQETLTKSNPKYKENQLWCKGHIPLSMGSNRTSWEARCNPGGKVKLADSGTPAPKAEAAVARPVISPPAMKDPAVAPAGRIEEAKSGAQGGFDSSAPMLGKPAAAPKVPETFPAGAAPVESMPVLKDPEPALTGSAEEVKSAAHGGFDTPAPMLGKPAAAPKVPATLPVGATPTKAAAQAASAKTQEVNSVKVARKNTQPPVERQLTAGNPAALAPKTAPTSKASPLSQKTVAEKQTQALSCAINDLQTLANGMGAEGSQLRSELKVFLADVRSELSTPCSGQSGSNNTQTLSLSGLTKDANKENQLAGSLLVTRNEESCEVHLDVQYASSYGSAKRLSNEGQSIIHLDKSGNILAAESPANVKKCLAGLRIKRQ